MFMVSSLQLSRVFPVDICALKAKRVYELNERLDKGSSVRFSGYHVSVGMVCWGTGTIKRPASDRDPDLETAALECGKLAI